MTTTTARTSETPGAGRRPRRSLPAIACMLLACTAALPAAAGPIYWDWPAGRDFTELELSGAALDAAGHLQPGPAVRVTPLAGEEVAWCALRRDDGSFLVGTGHEGRIHRVTSDGAAVWAEPAAQEIFCLAPLPDGGVLAGSAPDGQVFRLDRDGEWDEVGRVDGGYVWSMAADPAGGDVWLVAGSPAAVWRFDAAAGRLQRVCELPARNALDVAVTDDGLLVATEGPGLVYRLAADGSRPQLVGETEQDEARRLRRGPDGRWYVLALSTDSDAGGAQDAAAGGAGGGRNGGTPDLMLMFGAPQEDAVRASALYEVTPRAGLRKNWEGDARLLACAWQEAWGWLAGGPASDGDHDGTTCGGAGKRTRLLHLSPPVDACPLTGWDGGDIVEVIAGGAGRGAWFAAVQSHPGALVVPERGRAAHAAQSPPLDGGARVRWGRLRWEGRTSGARPSWSVRGGDRAEPDASWTAWSDAWSDADHALPLEPCRYLQWRVEFPSEAEDAQVTGVSVSAWRDNRAPVVRTFQLEHLQGLMSGSGAVGGDNVTYKFRSGLQAEFTRQSPTDPWPGPTRPGLGQTVRVFTWEASDPDDDRLAYRLEYRAVDGEDWLPVRLAGGDPWPFSGGVGSWDTGDVPDGAYEVRLTASDHRDNPGAAALQAQRLLGPVTVDNGAPRIADLRAQRTEDGFQLTCRAEDERSVLAGARLRLPDGTLERLDPADGVCDSRREDFDARVAWPRAGGTDGVAGTGPWHVRVEIRDMAGNVATAEAVVR